MAAALHVIDGRPANGRRLILTGGNVSVGPRELNWNANSVERSRLSVYNGLLWAVIALSPFQDTFLQKTPLKLPAASLSFLPLMALFILAGIQRLLRRPLTISRPMLIMAVYAAVVCIANVVWVTNGEAVLYTQSLFARGLLAVLVLFAMFGINYRFTRWLRVAVYLGFFFTIVGIACDRLLGANAIVLLQNTPSFSGKPRGFCTEASTLSVQIVASGMLTAHFLTRPWQKWTVGILTAALLVLSNSKGGLISLLLCIVVLGVVKTRSSVLAKVGVSFVLLPLIYFGSLFIFSIFGALIEVNQTSTIATRLSMAVYALITLAHNPFGVGFTGFLPSIPRYLPQAMRFVQGLFPLPLAFVEVRGYLYPPQSEADCKTLFFDFLVFFGIPFAIVFFRFVGGLLRELFKIQCNWLFVGVLFSAMAMMTYYSTVNAWTLPLLFGISLGELKRAGTSP
jgi:hypothetical protein